jgi:hypothetical protein
VFTPHNHLPAKSYMHMIILSQSFADWRPEGIFWIVYGPNAATSEKIQSIGFYLWIWDRYHLSL